MVCSGGDRERVVVLEMGTTSGSGGADGGGVGRSFKAPLHNFDLPSFLKWGQQRQLRCQLPEKKHAGDGNRRLVGDRSRWNGNGSPPAVRAKRPAPEEGIDAVREKIMFDLKTAAERMKVAIFREEAAAAGGSDDDEDDDDEDEEVVAPVREKSMAEEEVRRWNLRTRRGSAAAAGKNNSSATAPVVVAGVASAAGGVGVGGRRVAGGYCSSSPLRGENGGSREEKKRDKFSVALSRREIEEDFFAMVGHRPARRPKKRPRTVQRQLDTLFPGLWLSEVTADTYKVPEGPDAGKR